MTTPLIRRLSFIPLCCLSLAACASDKPTRSECIVKVVSSSPAATRFREGGLDDLMPAASRREIPLAGYKVASPEIVYLQYGERCDDRSTMSRLLLSDTFPQGNYSISKDMVVPGPETIDIVGNKWRD